MPIPAASITPLAERVHQPPGERRGDQPGAAKALINGAGSVLLTPKWRANSRDAGATTPESHRDHERDGS